MTEGLIHKKMALIMGEIAPIAKERRNQQQGYNFRGIDDVYAAVQQIMAKHGVYSLPTVLADRTEDRTTSKGAALIYRVLTIRYDFYAEDGSSVAATVVGEGMDSGDKASNKAMSVAEKYCLLQAYKIPTHEPKDPENDSHELAAAKPEATATPKPKAAPPEAMISAAGAPLKFTRAELDAVMEEATRGARPGDVVVYDTSRPGHKRLFGMACYLLDVFDPAKMRAISDVILQHQVPVDNLKAAVADFLQQEREAQP